MTPEMGFTAKENYWQVVSWYDMPYGKVARGMWIGWAKNPDDRIWWENPRPPEDPSEILNWGKPVNEQVWVRHELPHFWEPAYLNEIARDRFTKKVNGKTVTDDYWYKDTNNLSDDQYEYQEREWDRRLRGVWVTIGGEITYLTGKYYMFLQWAWLVDTYPEYLERQLLIHYAWQSVCDDLLCRGMVIPKGRRGGLTSIFAFEGLEETTRTKGGHFGIQARGDDGAKKVFNDKVKPAWKKFPLFFRPIASNGDNPVGEIIMDVESRRGRTQHIAALHEGLEGWVKYAPNGKEGVDPFDGDKLTRFFRDEGGKEVRVDILDNWELVSPTLIGRTSRGKAAWPSSVEDVSGKFKNAYKKLCEASMPSLRGTTGSGTTTSYMWTLFLPCYCSHPEYWFIGKFGESIVHTPTPEQREWLLANRAQSESERRELEKIYDQGGAYEYEMRQRASKNNDPGYIRKNPFTLDECFITVNTSGIFDQEKLVNLREQLRSLTIVNGKTMTLHEKLTVRGRLEWTAGMVSPVVFREDVTGPFEWNREYLPVFVDDTGRIIRNYASSWGGETAERLRIFPNRFNRDQSGVFPSTDCRIRIGVDPQKTDGEDAVTHKTTLSKAAAHGFIPWDSSVDTDPWNESDPMFAENYISHAYIFQYFNLPKVSFAVAEDMLKAAVFLNAKVHSEKQVATIIQFFKNVGAGRYLLYDKNLNGVSVMTKRVVAGQASTVESHQQADDRIRDFLHYHSYPSRFPHLETINQLIDYDGTNNNVLDLKVSAGMMHMAVQPTAVAAHKIEQAKMLQQKDDGRMDKVKWAKAYGATLSGGITM